MLAPLQRNPAATSDTEQAAPTVVTSPPQPLKTSDQPWVRWYSGTRDGLTFRLCIRRSASGHLSARYFTEPGEPQGWHLDGQLRQDGFFALKGSENSTILEGTLPPQSYGDLMLTRFQHGRFQLTDLALRRTNAPKVTVKPAATSGQTGQSGGEGPPALKAGTQEWQRWYGGQHEGVKFTLYLRRDKSGTLSGHYQVEGASGSWPLEGELRSNDTFVLRGTRNSASFEGRLSPQGPATVTSFKRGEFQVTNLQLEQVPAPAAAVPTRAPLTPPGPPMSPAAPTETTTTPQTGEGGHDNETPVARWTGVTPAREREILSIPKRGYSTGEAVQMTGGVETGSLNGVKGYYNGPVEAKVWGSSYGEKGEYYGQKWQCVEYVRRYTHIATGRLVSHRGDAKTWYNPGLTDGAATFNGLVQNRNTALSGGEITGSKTKPKPNDIVVIATNTYGHVAVIASVGAGNVEIAQQNVSTKFRDVLPLNRIGGKWAIGGRVKCWLSDS